MRGIVVAGVDDPGSSLITGNHGPSAEWVERGESDADVASVNICLCMASALESGRTERTQPGSATPATTDNSSRITITLNGAASGEGAELVEALVLLSA
jgi:hypothetical protein